MWHVTVLRDVRDSQSEPLLPLLSWRSSHSDDWPLQLSASLAVPCQFCLDRCCQSGNVLLRCNDFRMVGLAVLFLLLGGHQLLQNTDDLAALRCVPLTGTARHERQQRGTITISHPCSWCIRAKRLHQQKSRRGSSCRLPALVFNHFDIQSRHGLHYESHGYSRRSPALVLVLNFSPLLTFRALHGNHIVSNTISDHREKKAT